MRWGLAITIVAAAASCGNDGRKPVANARPVAQADAAPAAVATKPAAEADAGAALKVEDRPDPERLEKILDAVGQQDFGGPSMTVPQSWQTCTAKSQCDVVYSGCGTQYVVVNKKSVARTEAAWKKTCAASGAKPVSLLAAMPNLACESRQCVETLGGGLGGAFDPESGGPGLPGVGGGTGKPVPRPRPPKVSMSQVTVRGSLPKNIVNRIVRQRLGSIRLCYRVVLDSAPKTRGKLKVSLVVTAAGGRPDKVSVNGGLPQSARDCVRSTVRIMRFPVPPRRDNVDARFELTFEPPPKS